MNISKLAAFESTKDLNVVHIRCPDVWFLLDARCFENEFRMFTVRRDSACANYFRLFEALLELAVLRLLVAWSDPDACVRI